MWALTLTSLTVLVLNACGGAEEPSADAPILIEPDTTVAKTPSPAAAPSVGDATISPGRAAPSATPPVSCSPAECAVVSVKLDEPRSLEGLRELATETGTALVAVWRTDPVCVPAVGRPPGTADPGALETSQFAYVQADLLRQVQNQGPPATDGGWSLAMRDRFVVEWAAAGEPGVRFAGAVLLTPGGELDHPSVDEQAPAHWYLTDETNVLYLRGHGAALAGFFEPTELPC